MYDRKICTMIIFVSALKYIYYLYFKLKFKNLIVKQANKEKHGKIAYNGKQKYNTSNFTLQRKILTFMYFQHFQSSIATEVLCSVISVVSDSVQPHGLQTVRFLSLCNFTSKNTGLGCHIFLQGIFRTQGLNLGLPHCRQML